LRVLETRGRQVELWANIPFSPGFIKNGVVADAAGLGQVIGSTFKTAKLSRRKVMCALNVPQAQSRVITVPKAKGVRPDKIIDREIRRQLPAAQDNCFTYWQPLEGMSMTQQRVYVLAVPREPVLALMAAMNAAGIRPCSMDLRAMALARSVNQKDAILANLETNTVDVVIVVDDIPAIMRSIYLGDEPVPLDVAQQRLLSELSRTINFYNDTNRGNPLAARVPVYLSGDLASDPDLVAPVEDASGHPVSHLAPPLLCPPDFPHSQYMVNIGLALKEL